MEEKRFGRYSNLILDLLCEALQRIGHSYRPKEGEGALLALAKAPSHIKELVSSLENKAKPGIPSGEIFHFQQSSTDKNTSIINILTVPGGDLARTDMAEIEVEMSHPGLIPDGSQIDDDNVEMDATEKPAAEADVQRQKDAAFKRSQDSQREKTRSGEAHQTDELEVARPQIVASSASDERGAAQQSSSAEGSGNEMEDQWCTRAYTHRFQQATMAPI